MLPNFVRRVTFYDPHKVSVQAQRAAQIRADHDIGIPPPIEVCCARGHRSLDTHTCQIQCRDESKIRTISFISFFLITSTYGLF
jgi:hypothetical protein